jgi:NAD(P)-dependent dehydrogenase (short-subunit alcohol dehydrogenase family)
MSQMFAREGARVVCAARSAALVEETAKLVRKSGGQAVAVVADVATEDGARQTVAQALRAFGTIDRLVNNAGDGGKGGAGAVGEGNGGPHRDHS